MKKVLSPIAHSRPPKAVLIVFVLLLNVIALVVFSNARASSYVDSQGRDEVRIELASNGFTPSEVQHAPGTFALAVENNTLPGEYTLRLRAEDGTLLNELQVQKGSSAWTVSLQAGRYTLTEVNHTQWLCRLVIQ